MPQKLILPLRKFVEARVAENYPNFDFRRSTALNDLCLNVFAMLVQPLRNELDEMKIAQSLKNYEYMTDDQMNTLLFNLLIFRKEGAVAIGIIRIFFYELSDYNYDQITFLTNDGLRFKNSFPISITPQNLSGNLTPDGMYFYDVVCESEETGAEYAIPNNQIVAIEEDLPEIAKTTNPAPFIQGESKETNFEAFQRAQDAVITRTLINEYSIRTVLFNEFPYLRDIKIVGAGDSNMIRDIVEACGQSVHTYGKTDVYIDSTTLQEGDVDIEYVPEDLKVNIASGSSTEIVFPISGDNSTGGNSRGLYFNDAYSDFETDTGYFNNILRVYETRFEEALWTDYIIKTQTPQGELVVVEEKTSEGTSLFPWEHGYLNLDTFVENHGNQYIFKGENGQGNDYRKTVFNGPNFIAATLPNTVTIDGINTASCASDSGFISISLDTTSINLTKDPTFVITQGDAVGGFPIVRVDNNQILVTGQIKTKSIVNSWSGYTITLNDTIDRSARVGDYLYAVSSIGDIELLTISAISFSVNTLFATNSLGFPQMNGQTVSIHDGLHGKLVSGQECFISEDNQYSTTSISAMGTAIAVTYGIGSENEMTYLSAANLGTAFPGKKIGDTLDHFLVNSTVTHPIISVISDTEVLLKGHLRGAPVPASGSSLYLRTPKKIESSPIISGLINFVASGTYDSDINTITIASGWTFNHPGLAVNTKPSTAANGKLYIVNYSTLETYPVSGSGQYVTVGLNGIRFSGASAGLTNNDEWAMTQTGEAFAGGSTWNDVFSWYGTPSIDNTTLTGSYPNDNPQIDLVIAGGPNKGVYSVLEITDANTLLIDTDLGEVSTTTASGVFKSSYISGSSSLMGEYVTATLSSFPGASIGDTLKITSGLAEGWYRITSRTGWGVTLDKPITGNVFGAVDSYEVLKDRFQPFFLTKNETSFQEIPNQRYEIWTPMDTTRRMTEGSRATVDGLTLVENDLDFSLTFANIPISNSTISFISGSNAGESALAISYTVSDPTIVNMNKSLVNSSDNQFEIYQNVQNLYQQEYQIIDQLDYYQDNFFVKPIVNIQDVIEIDPITGEALGDSLVPNQDYFLYSRSEETKYTRYSADEKVILKFNESFKYKGMRITYIGDPSVTVVNQFVSKDLMRCTNNDTLVKRMESTIVNVSCEVEGITIEQAEEIISSYITVQKSEDPVQTSDIISLLYTSGATYVNTETFQLQSYYLPPTASGEMWTVNPSSRTEIRSSSHATYIPGIITVTTISSS